MAVVNAQAQAAQSSVNFIKSVGFKTVYDDDGNIVQGAVGDPIYVTFKYPKELSPYQPRENPSIVNVNLTSPGSGYAEDESPAVTFAGDTGGASAKAVVSGGVVTEVNLDSPGDYDFDATAPTGVTLAAPTSGTGTAATADIIWKPKKEAVAAQFAEMKLEVPILTMLPIPFIRIEETTIDFNAKINSIEEAETDTSFKLDSSLEIKGKYPPIFSAVTAKLKVSTSYQKNTQSGYKVDRTYSMAVHIRAVQDEMPAGTDRILGILEDAIRSQPIG